MALHWLLRDLNHRFLVQMGFVTQATEGTPLTRSMSALRIAGMAA